MSGQEHHEQGSQHATGTDAQHSPQARPGPGPDSRRPTRAQVGRIGEDLAARFLVDQGWQVVERNWRPARPLRGELDIIALAPPSGSVQGTAAPMGAGTSRETLTPGESTHPPVLVSVEVKTRTSGTAGPPAQAVTPAKLVRLRALTCAWASGHCVPHAGLRIDVISVLLQPGRPAQIHHHRGVHTGADR